MMNSSNTSNTSVWQRRRAMAAIAVSAAMVACGTQGSEQDLGDVAAPAQAKQATTPPAAKRLRPAALLAPAVSRTLVRSGATSYEVEVQSPKGFSPRAFDPVLRIGDKDFSSYRESSLVGEYGAVFRVDRPAFDALAEGSEVLLGYDRKLFRSVKLGRLDKRALAIR